jgi:putative acetyltransferase
MSAFTIRDITADDDVAVAAIIRTVMPQFGASGPGFAIHDPEVGAMSAEYRKPRSAYVVVVDAAGIVVGGGGVAPLAGGDGDVCELKKMYFLEVARGKGLGERVLTELLQRARAFGFSRMYLETLSGMDAAMKLYRKMGFAPGCRRGATGHFGCDHFFERAL